MVKPSLDIQPQAGGTHAVLVAAREGSMRFLLACTLANSSYRIHEEESEDAAVMQAEISRPSLLVVDSDLVEGDGIEVCRRVKQSRLTRGAAVIVVTARAEQSERDRAEAAGADAFLIKPFSPSRLLSIAQAVCEASRVRGALRAKPAPREGWYDAPKLRTNESSSWVASLPERRAAG